MLEDVWNHLMITAWLGCVHVAVVVFAIALWCLPHPVACFVLGTYAVAAVWPIAPPVPQVGRPYGARGDQRRSEVLPRDAGMGGRG